MKTYQQRTENIDKKAKRIKSQRKSVWLTVTASCCAVVLIVSAVLVPVLTAGSRKNNNGGETSTYAALVSKLQDYNSKHNFGFEGSIGGDLASPPMNEGTASGGSAGAEQPSNPTDAPNNKYEETTLNQVDGVTEADLVKRSTTHAFCLTQDDNYSDTSEATLSLKVYSLQKENSALVGTHKIIAKDGTTIGPNYRTGAYEMYLSQDAQTATVLFGCRYKSTTYTCIVSLDVSNPQHITENCRKYVSGQYISSRKVAGDILVITDFSIPYRVDYTNPVEFVPHVGSVKQPQCFDMSEIYLPDQLYGCDYTVVAKMDEKTLTVSSKQSVLSYTEHVSVSSEHVFVTRSATLYYAANNVLVPDYSLATSLQEQTEIVWLSYKDTLQQQGAAQVDGYIKDRYSLDEKDGILRIFTTTSNSQRTGGTLWNFREATSASLFCIDTETAQTVAKVENFCPEGESVQAVRFNGNTAYVCTAKRFTDPVFAFDLTNLQNITYTDTGTITGYSISLIPFGDALLGIGYDNSSSSLKIEAYTEQDDAVVSLDAYVKDMCYFSGEYKAHFVDAERQLVGLAVYDYDTEVGLMDTMYLLLRLQEGTFQTVAYMPISNANGDYVRAFYCDGVYVITGQQDGIHFIAA